MQIGNAVAPLNRTPKILGVTLNTSFTFDPHARDCVERVSRALNVMKALVGWPPTKPSCALSSIMPLPFGSPQVSSIHLNKLEMIQNKAVPIVTGCNQKASASYLRAETGVLPLRAHSELCSQQYYGSALLPMYPCDVGATPPSSLIPGRAPQFSDLPPLQIDFNSFPS